VNDLLDDRLRTMMRTATADAPEAPSIDDLRALVVVHDAPTADRRRPVFAVAAAAVLALGAVGALVFWPGDDAGQPADTPDTTAAVLPGGYLDAYYLPAEFLDGWQIVEMNRYPGGGQVESWGDSAVFETRDGSVRAVVSREPTADDGTSPATTEAALDPATGSAVEVEPVPTSAAEATWNSRDSALIWRQDGRAVWLTPSDELESSARSLAADLVVTRAGGRVIFGVVDDSDWVQTAEYLLDGVPVVSAGENSMQLADDAGSVAVIGITRTTGARIDETGAPVPGEEDLYRPAGSLPNMVIRSIDDVQISAFSYDGSASTADLVALLRSLTQVTEEDWLAAQPDPDVLVRGATIVVTFELLEHVVTVHRDGPVGGVCVVRPDGATGCAGLIGVGEDGSLPQSFPATGFPLSDGSWVAVSSIPAESQVCSPSELPDGATMAATPNGGDEQVVLLAVRTDVAQSVGQSIACALGGENPDFPIYVVNPPTQG
jgi:hypothetical protein